MIRITKYLKNYVNEQIEKSSKISSNEEDQEIEETRPNVTFCGQNPYKSIKRPFKVRSDGRVIGTRNV